MLVAYAYRVITQLTASLRFIIIYYNIVSDEYKYYSELRYFISKKIAFISYSYDYIRIHFYNLR